LKRPPCVKFHWNRYLALIDDYPDRVQEICAGIVDLIEIPESEHTAASQASKPGYAIILHGPLISATLVIDRYFKPKLTSGHGMDKGGVRQADFEYFLVREGQKQKFLSDCLLHVGSTKMESSSKVLLLAIAITGGGRMPNSGLVLRQFGVTESGAHICTRIGMFDNLSRETNGWFDTVEMASVLIL